jgi:hypothetical protein
MSSPMFSGDADTPLGARQLVVAGASASLVVSAAERELVGSHAAQLKAPASFTQREKRAQRARAAGHR